MKSSKGQQSHTSYVTMSVTVVLFLLGLCLLLFLHANRIGNLIKQEMDIVLELRKGSDSKTRYAIEDKLKALNEIDVNSLEFVSSKDAFSALKSDYLNGVEIVENPLLDLISFNMNADAYSESNLKYLEENVMTWEGVEALYYQNDETLKAKESLSKIGFFVLLLSTFFVIMAILLIINTLRLRLYADRMEIKTMQTVGAKNSFIKKPYLHRSMGIGFRGSIYAGLLLLALLVFCVIRIDGFDNILSWIYVALVILALFVFATGLLLLVSNNQLNNYLRKSIGEVI